MSLLQKLVGGVRRTVVRLRRVAIAMKIGGKARSLRSPADSTEIGTLVPSRIARVPEQLATAADHLATAAGVEDAATGEANERVRARTGGRFREFGFSCRAGSRQFMLYLPTRPKSRSMPLVVMLHGCRQTPEDFALGTRMNEFAERDSFAVAYPAQSRIHNVTKCWNWFRQGDQSRGAGEPEIIASLTRDLVQHHGLDPGRVYVAGLSAGGAMAAILGDAYPDLYAAVGVHSSVPHGVAVGIVSALALMRHGRADASRVPRGDRDPSPRTPVIVFHGDADTTVNPRNAAEVYSRSIQFAHAQPSRRLRLSETVESGQVPDGRSYTRTRWIDRSGVAMSELWVVHESGHAWSGGDVRGLFTDPHGPDASAEMLRFFFKHRLTRES